MLLQPGILLSVFRLCLLIIIFKSFRPEWIGREILDLMDPSRYNFNAIKNSYLDNMFRIVRKKRIVTNMKVVYLTFN